MGFTIRPVSQALGAEVVGLDVSRPLEDAAFARIHQAHLDHQVLVFRDQRLTPRQQIAFSRRFGPLDAHPSQGDAHLADFPEILVVSTKKKNGKDVGVRMIQGVPILFAYNVRADMPEDVVYKLVSAFYKNRESLAKADPGFTPMARDFVGMQVQGISANPDVPVHAGLAKFLREQKAWNEKWKVAK